MNATRTGLGPPDSPRHASGFGDDVDWASRGGISGGGRDDRVDAELHFVLGPKLQDSLDHKLRHQDGTWTTLKTALTNRYGERPDKSMAEWRVGQ
ncbi:hypothetical protein PHMEG_00017922 [Phytophthora megakarya]|uniref:Uncharacterized protein n=1 Tax=Phytophthora megakarya TaxID=4795 RepID=A0A225VX68_9STRA|nr:hypothetical protein PHMEG_00017922 [Phytophthora megakarya]